MQVPQHFDASLTSSATTTISVMQGDGLRLLVAQLKKDTEPWPVPDGISAGLSYELPDQAPGYYDRLNDGTPACVINGDQVSVILEPILTEQPGPVKASIILRDPDGIQIATFPFHILVEQVPGMVHGKNLQAPAHAFNEKIYYGGVGGILQPLGLGRGMQAEKQKDGSLLLVAEGNTPVRGVDYWTAADQEAIVQQVIAALGTPVFGRVDGENNIILTGELAEGTYTLKYEDGEGNVTEIGTLNHAVVPEPAYTNLADPTSGDWLVGYRMSSTGEIKAESVTHVSNYIPVKVGDVVRVRGQNLFFHGSGTGYATQTFYNANKECVAKLTYAQGTSDIYGTTADADNEPVGDFVYTVANGAEIVSGDVSDIAYVRFSGRLWNGYTADDVIITVNQEITE